MTRLLGARAARPQDDLLQSVSIRLSGSAGGPPAKIILRYVIHFCAKCFCVARGAEALGACRTSGQVFIRRCTHPGCNSGARHPWLARHTYPEAHVDPMQGLPCCCGSPPCRELHCYCRQIERRQMLALKEPYSTLEYHTADQRAACWCRG